MSNEEFITMLKSEESKRAIMEMIIADLRASGPIRMALLGMFPEVEDKPEKLDA